MLTALFLHAAHGGVVKEVVQMLNSGAVVNHARTDNGSTALIMAAIYKGDDGKWRLRNLSKVRTTQYYRFAKSPNELQCPKIYTT